MAHTLGSPSRRANQRYLHRTVRARGPHSGQPVCRGPVARAAGWPRWSLQRYTMAAATRSWPAAGERHCARCGRAGSTEHAVLLTALGNGGRLRSAERQTAAQAARQSGNVPQLASGTGRWQAAEERGEAALCSMQAARQYGACRLANGSTQRRAAGMAASRPGQAGRVAAVRTGSRLQVDSL